MLIHYRWIVILSLTFAGTFAFVRTTFAQPALDRLEKRLFGEKKPTEPLPEPPSVLIPSKPGGKADAAQTAPTLEGASKGEPGYLGATCDDAGLNGKGVAVMSVRGGGPADKAGLKPGDRIVLADHRTISKLEDLGKALGSLPPGSEVELEVSRNAQREILKVTLGVRPAAIPDPGELPPAGEGGRAVLGLHVGSITPAARELYRITAKKGALVDGITPGSPADRAGFPLGAVVVAVDTVPVESPEDLRGLIAAAKPGDEVELSYYQADNLKRQKIKLAGTASAVAAGTGNSLPPPPPGPLGRLEGRRTTEERPVLKALGKALDGIGEGRRPGTAPQGGGDTAAQIESLSAQVELLQRQNEELTRRIRQLEERQGSK